MFWMYIKITMKNEKGKQGKLKQQNKKNKKREIGIENLN